MSQERPLDPQKLLRLANLVREVLEEVRKTEPQEATVVELASLYQRVEKQLQEALPEELAKELEAINLDLPFKDKATGEEIRVVYSGLLGWLGGLFQGLQASAQANPVRLLEPSGAEPGPPQAPESNEDKEQEGYL